MTIRNHSILLFIVIALLAAGGTAGLQEKQRHDQAAEDQRRVKEVIRDLPVADFDAALPASSSERARRKVRGKKYNRGHPGSIGPGVETTEIYDWPTDFPALPVSQSDAVIVGQVFDARACLSTDRTSVYSEFGVTVDFILKDYDQFPIQPGSQLIVERLGGNVKYPSGQMSSVSVAGFGVPRVGSGYVFFLKRNPQEEGYTLTTGYELRLGRVYPLDRSTSSGTDFSIYDNSDEAKFLDDLRRITATARQMVP